MGNGSTEVTESPPGAAQARAAEKAVPHFTREERAARGKAARAEVPRSAQAEIEFPEPRDPVALLEEQAVTRVPELVPIRYGRMLVSPFAFYRGGALIMAADLARTPNVGPARAAVRGRAPVELRGVRLAGAEPRLRHQRLRRDGAGPVGVGREAAGGELRDRRTRERLLREGAARGCARHRPLLPGGDDRLRADAQPRPLVLAPVGRAGVRGVQRRRRPEAAEEGGSQHREVAHQGQHARLREADAPRRRRASDHQRPAADRADRRAPPRARSSETQSRTRCAASIRSYRRTLETDRRHLLEQFRFVDLARKVVGVGSVGTRAWIALFLGIDDAGPAVPADQGGAAVGARAIRRQERVQQLRPARRRRPAPDAGHQRHLPRLAARQLRPRRQGARLLRPPAQGLEGLVRRSKQPSPPARPRTGRRAAGHSPARTPAPATGSRSPPTSASRTPSTRRSPTSPRRTPTRTNATTTLSIVRSSRAGSLREWGCRAVNTRRRVM